jgi:hypothetical protein
MASFDRTFMCRNQSSSFAEQTGAKRRRRITHSPCKRHGIGQKQLTENIGEPLILDISLFRIFCPEK